MGVRAGLDGEVCANEGGWKGAVYKDSATAKGGEVTWASFCGSGGSRIAVQRI